MTAHADERSDPEDMQGSIGVKYYRVDDRIRNGWRIAQTGPRLPPAREPIYFGVGSSIQGGKAPESIHAEDPVDSPRPRLAHGQTTFCYSSVCLSLGGAEVRRGRRQRGTDDVRNDFESEPHWCRVIASLAYESTSLD